MTTSNPNIAPNIPIATLLDLFADPARSFLDIANHLHLSFQDLTLLCTRPAFLAELNQLNSLTAFRARFIAALSLGPVIAHLQASLKQTLAESEASTPNFSDPLSLTLAQRRRESARRSCALLLRLARFTAAPLSPDFPTPPSSNPTPSPQRTQPQPQPSEPKHSQAQAIHTNPAPIRGTQPQQPTPQPPATPTLLAPVTPIRPAANHAASPARQLQAALLRSSLPQPMS